MAAPCPGAGGNSRGSSTSRLAPSIPRRRRPARASTVASAAPARTRPPRGGPFPRLGPARRAGRPARRGALRRRLPRGTAPSLAGRPFRGMPTFSPLIWKDGARAAPRSAGIWAGVFSTPAASPSLK